MKCVSSTSAALVVTVQLSSNVVLEIYCFVFPRLILIILMLLCWFEPTDPGHYLSLVCLPPLSDPLQVPVRGLTCQTVCVLLWACAGLFVPFLCGWVVFCSSVSTALSQAQRYRMERASVSDLILVKTHSLKVCESPRVLQLTLVCVPCLPLPFSMNVH